MLRGLRRAPAHLHGAGLKEFNSRYVNPNNMKIVEANLKPSSLKFAKIPRTKQMGLNITKPFNPKKWINKKVESNSTHTT